MTLDKVNIEGNGGVAGLRAAGMAYPKGVHDG